MTHIGPLVVMIFANAFIFYTFRLVNQFASKKCEIHLGEVYVQVRASIVNDVIVTTCNFVIMLISY